MTYEYTDEDGDTLAVKTLDPSSIVVGITNDYEYNNAAILNKDAPRVALEILKAAGWVTTSGSIGGDLEAVARANEARS